MKLIAIFMLATLCMNRPQAVLSEHNDNTTSTEIDTIVSEIDTFYSYIFIPRTYTKNKDGTANRIEPHWVLTTTLQPTIYKNVYIREDTNHYCPW